MAEVLIFQGRQAPAMMAKEALEEAKIPYWLRSDHGEGFILRAGALLEDYYIYVRKEDEEKARKIVEYFVHWKTEDRGGDDETFL
ncbi:MAG: DUF2007 domain-containing protein [Tissierellia bacterium]|nr:DUF2007 domain-containing protein [Tissierellia bacterium]